MVNYEKECYQYFRVLVRDIVKEYPDSSEDTLEAEMDYVKKRLDDMGLYGLFQAIFNKNVYYDWIICRPYKDIDDYKRYKENASKIDFSILRKSREESKDVIWILGRTGARYPKKKIYAGK